MAKVYSGLMVKFDVITSKLRFNTGVFDNDTYEGISFTVAASSNGSRVGAFLVYEDNCSNSIEYVLSVEVSGRAKGWLYECDYINDECAESDTSCNFPNGDSVQSSDTTISLYINDAGTIYQSVTFNSGVFTEAIGYAAPYVEISSAEIVEYGILVEAGDAEMHAAISNIELSATPLSLLNTSGARACTFESETLKLPCTSDTTSASARRILQYPTDVSSCEDSTTWYRTKSWKDCDWVSKNTDVRCILTGTDGTYAYENCLSACGCDTNAPTSSPTTSSTTYAPTRLPTSPSVLPIPQPTSSTSEPIPMPTTFEPSPAPNTLEPSSAPTYNCKDSATWYRGNNPWKDCDWVSLNTDARCSYKGSDGTYAHESCLNACGCDKTGSPIPAPTLVPTTLPSSLPMSAPTDVPTRTPTSLPAAHLFLRFHNQRHLLLILFQCLLLLNHLQHLHTTVKTARRGTEAVIPGKIVPGSVRTRMLVVVTRAVMVRMHMRAA